MKHLVLVIALAAFSTSAFAEGTEQNAQELRLVKGFSVVVADGVKDGCLANPNALKVEAELIFRRLGVTVFESYQPGFHLLAVTASGIELRPAGTCAVTLDVRLQRVVNAPEGHLVTIEAYSSGGLLSGYNKPEMQEALRTKVSEIVSDLANEILKARGN